jgi:hypothetical protein
MDPSAEELPTYGIGWVIQAITFRTIASARCCRWNRQGTRTTGISRTKEEAIFNHDGLGTAHGLIRRHLMTHALK